MKNDEIRARIERLSPEARALFWAIWWPGEETEVAAPLEVVLVGDEMQRLDELPIEDRREFSACSVP